MGHKVHPYGFRLGVSRTWTAKWYADPKEYTASLKEDILIRQLIDDTRQVGCLGAPGKLEAPRRHLEGVERTVAPHRCMRFGWLPPGHRSPPSVAGARRLRLQ